MNLSRRGSDSCVPLETEVVDDGGRWRRVVDEVMVVVKMRGGNHSKDIREYIINKKGVILIGPRQTEYARLTTGIPERIGPTIEPAPEPKAKK